VTPDAGRVIGEAQRITEALTKTTQSTCDETAEEGAPELEAVVAA
jgi:hypothetical protein